MRKLKRRDLETLRLLVPHQGRKVPSIGGLLLFGRDREAHFPDAWIQAGRFAGTDKTNILDSAALHGPLPKVIEAAIQFVQKHGLHGFDIGAVRRTDHWSLPPVALREAIINAVVHADYAPGCAGRARPGAGNWLQPTGPQTAILQGDTRLR